jgi:hypothetical protein
MIFSNKIMVKKWGTITIGIVIFAIILGIASIPDEVLEESSSFETTPSVIAPQSKTPASTPIESQSNQPSESIQTFETQEPNTIEPTVETLESNSNESPLEVQSESIQPASESNVKSDNIIRIEISDGVGTGDR